jgi:hypothetical protein
LAIVDQPTGRQQIKTLSEWSREALGTSIRGWMVQDTRRRKEDLHSVDPGRLVVSSLTHA